MNQGKTPVSVQKAVISPDKRLSGNQIGSGTQITGVGSFYQGIEVGAITDGVNVHVIQTDRRFDKPPAVKIYAFSQRSRKLPAVRAVFAVNAAACGRITPQFLPMPEIGADHIDEPVVIRIKQRIQTERLRIGIAVTAAVKFLA